VREQERESVQTLNCQPMWASSSSPGRVRVHAGCVCVFARERVRVREGERETLNCHPMWASSSSSGRVRAQVGCVTDSPITSSCDTPHSIQRCRVQGSGFRVQGSGFRVQGAGFRVQGYTVLDTSTREGYMSFSRPASFYYFPLKSAKVAVNAHK